MRGVSSTLSGWAAGNNNCASATFYKASITCATSALSSSISYILVSGSNLNNTLDFALKLRKHTCIDWLRQHMVTFGSKTVGECYTSPMLCINNRMDCLEPF